MNFDKNHVAHKKSIPAGTRIFRRISLTALKIFLVLLLFCVILGTAAGVGMIKGLIASAPNIDSLSVAPAESATYIYNTGNKPVQKLAESTSNRILVKLDQIRRICSMRSLPSRMSVFTSITASISRVSPVPR